MLEQKRLENHEIYYMAADELPLRSVLLEIHTLRTSLRMEVPLVFVMPAYYLNRWLEFYWIKIYQQKGNEINKKARRH